MKKFIIFLVLILGQVTFARVYECHIEVYERVDGASENPVEISNAVRIGSDDPIQKRYITLRSDSQTGKREVRIVVNFNIFGRTDSDRLFVNTAFQFPEYSSIKDVFGKSQNILTDRFKQETQVLTYERYWEEDHVICKLDNDRD